MGDKRMGKSIIVYVCGQCGYESPKWLGKCPSCTAWNTLTEDVRAAGPGLQHYQDNSCSIPISEIAMEEEKRLSSGNMELDRILGGGIVPGSLILLGGDPGVGKSTLLLQTAQEMASSGLTILYLSGEESLQQIKLRAERLNINHDRIFLLNEQSIESLEKHIKEINPHLVIVDSIQTVYVSGLSSIPGSVTQLRESTVRIAKLAKKSNRGFFLIGHVTKDGALAGPKVLEHMVDVVIYFEGEKNYSLRVLRSVKNRYGSTDEIGLLEMSSSGLTEVRDPSFAFIDNHNQSVSGIAITPVYEGSRPFLVEIQALATPTGPGYARRMASGVDQNRLALIVAVLEKRLGIHLAGFDIYLKVSGGVFLKDPAVDLGMAAAIVSSYYDLPLPLDSVFAGEISLSGLINKASFLEIRLKEAERMGYKRAFISEHSRIPPGITGLELVTIENIKSLGTIME